MQPQGRKHGAFGWRADNLGVLDMNPGRWPRLCAWRIVVLAAFALAATAAPSAAIMVKLPDGHYANFDPMGGSKTPLVARKFDAFFTNLDYSGGPVMPSSTNYVVVWQPSNYGSHTPFQTGYTTGVNQFFSDMAHDKGLATNSDAVSTQYNDATGHTSAYNFTNGGVLTDTDPLPANGCPAFSGDICITDAQIQAELNHFLSGHAADLQHEYYLLTPPDVASCFDSAGSQCSGNADLNQAYCAYHSQTTAGFVYSNIPDLTGLYGCDPFVTFCPNINCNYNNGPADGVLSAISHEHNESITDPQPNNAWTDWGSNVGGEIGDKCNNDGLSDPNVQLQDDGSGNDTPYNEVINSHHYLIQREWSNQGHACLDSFTAGSTVVTASFTSSSGSGNTMTFNAAGSSGGVAEYVWQFNDGPYPQNTTIETTSPTISHTFPSAGTYDVALTVMASDGTSNGAAHNVTVGTTAPPVAVFSPPTGLEGTSLTFDGSSSTGSITTYSWNFGDGTTGSGSVAHHIYAKYGNYTAILTVSGGGGSNAVSHTVVVTDEKPTSAFTFSPTSPSPGTPVSFSGATSSDPDGTISSYAWTFGDGSSTTGATPSHTYSSTGSYTVTLKVTDSDGQSASSTKQITVAPTFQNPTAAFSAPAGGLEGQALTFNASGSSDPNSGGSLSYSWNFGDGGAGSGVTAAHAFAAGVYTVTLTVTDSASGLTNSVSHTVTISDESPTTGLFQASGTAGSPVAFTGFGSDPDGTIVSFVWSFGDGGTGSGANPTHVYAHAGSYTVTVTIVDSAGHSASAAESVTIAPAPTHGPQHPNCLVPKLKGKTLSAARKLLSAAHCKLGKVKSAKHKPKRSAGRHHKWELVVAKQSPPAGRTEPNNTAIALTLTYQAVKTH